MSGAYRSRTEACVGLAWRSAFVSASCTTRKAARSRPGGSGTPLALDHELDVEAGGADGAEQRVERAEARLRCERRRLAVLAQQADHAPHLGHRVAPGALHREQRVALATLVLAEHAPDGAGLDGHHRHGVRDHVVELAGDPPALLEHGAAGGVGLILLEPGGVLLGGAGARDRVADQQARPPRRRS